MPPVEPPKPTIPRSLFAFSLLYGGMAVLAGVLAFKQIQLWPTDLAVDGGIFAFLLLVVISSTISQIYGRKVATQMVWWGFVPIFLSAGLMTLALYLPPSTEMLTVRGDDLAAFERVHGQLWRVMLAGPVAYVVSLLLNIWIFDRLRGTQSNRTLGLMVRGAIAAALSQAVDAAIFITLAFYGRFDITNLLIGQILAKVSLSLLLVPILLVGARRLADWIDRKPL